MDAFDEQRDAILKVDRARGLRGDGLGDCGLGRGAQVALEVAGECIAIDVEHKRAAVLRATEDVRNRAAAHGGARAIAVERYPQLAAAGEANLEREVVGDAVVDQPRCLAVTGEELLRGAVDVALDAAARHRAGHLAARRDGEDAADRARGGAVRAHDGRERDVVATGGPGGRGLQGLVVHAAALSVAGRTPECRPSILRSASASDSSAFRLWPGRKVST